MNLKKYNKLHKDNHMKVILKIFKYINKNFKI